VSNRITDHEAGQRWGWYQTIDSYPGGTNSYTFKMWAGAGQYNAANEGVYMGDVVVTVNECQETNGKKSTSSTADWSGLGADAGLCLYHPTDEHHVHVDQTLPLSNDGSVTFGPGSFKPKCCVAGSPCVIMVHGVAQEFYNKGCASCEFLP